MVCSPIIPLGRGRALAGELGPAEAEIFGRTLEEQQASHPGFLTRLSDEQLARWARLDNCGAGYRSCVVDPMGGVRPCPLMADLGMGMGNLVEDGFERVLGSDVPAFLRALHAPGDSSGDGCASRRACRGCILAGFLQHDATGDGCRWAARNGIGTRLEARTGARTLPGCPSRREYVFAPAASRA